MPLFSYVDIDQQFAQISLRTGSDGGYSSAIPDPEAAAQTVTASAAAISSTASASAQLGFTTDAVAITGSFDPPYVNAFSTGTLSWVASYISGGSPHPLANSTLSITSPGDDDLPAISATVETSADGSFSYVTPQTGAPSDGPESAEFTVSSAATPYQDAGQLTIFMPINQVPEINNFSGTLS